LTAMIVLAVPRSIAIESVTSFFRDDIFSIKTFPSIPRSEPL
jgi:hypothetical protein